VQQHCTAAEYHVWVYLGSIDEAVGIGVFCVTGQGAFYALALAVKFFVKVL
jgi:hypothetical protein